MTPRLHRFALFCCVPLLVPIYFLPMRFKVALVVITLLSWVARVEAMTNNAATANYSDVLAACIAANDGDVVVIPPGNVGWSQTLGFVGKHFFLEGSGIGSTIITDAVSSVTGSTLIDWNMTPSSIPSAIQGIEFRGIPGQSNPNTGIITVEGNAFNFRVCSNLNRHSFERSRR